MVIQMIFILHFQSILFKTQSAILKIVFQSILIRNHFKQMCMESCEWDSLRGKLSSKTSNKHKPKWSERGSLIRMRFETDRSFNWSFRLSDDEFMSQQAFVGRNSREMRIEIKAIAHKINWTLHYRVWRPFMTVSWWIQFAPMPHCLSGDA